MARFHNCSKPTVIVYLEAQHLVKKWVELKNLGYFSSDSAFAEHLLEQEERRYQILSEHSDQNTLGLNDQTSFATGSEKQKLSKSTTGFESKTGDSDSVAAEENEPGGKVVDLKAKKCIGDGEKSISVLGKNETSENRNDQAIGQLRLIQILNKGYCKVCKKSFEGTLPHTCVPSTKKAIPLEPRRLKKFMYASRSNKITVTKSFRSKDSSTEVVSVLDEFIGTSVPATNKSITVKSPKSKKVRFQVPKGNDVTKTYKNKLNSTDSSTQGYNCICGLSFHTENAWKTHHRLHHNNKINICKFCSFRTKEVDLLVTHFKLRHPEIVAGLGATVDFKDVSTMTKTKEEAEQLLNTLKPFQCKVCFKRMALSNKKKHMKLHPLVQIKFDNRVVDSKEGSTVTDPKQASENQSLEM